MASPAKHATNAVDFSYSSRSAAQLAVAAVSLSPPPTQYAAGRDPPVLIKGMSFADGPAAVRLIQDYALHHNKQVRVGCRGGKHRKLVCSSHEPCPFFVQIYQRHSKNGDTSWYLSSIEPTHSEACTSTAKPTQRQLVDMASFKEAIASKPGVSAASLATYVGDQSRVPLRLHLRTVYRAKEALRNTLIDTQAQSFRRIPALLHEFAKLNSGSYVAHDLDQHGRFRRAFVACAVFTQASPYNQQVFGFHCVHTNGMFPCAQLYLLGKDGNRVTLVVAAAVVMLDTHGETVYSEHLAWFFRCVQAAGVEIQSRPIFSTARPELLEIESELGVTFRLCTWHVIETELTKIAGFNEHHHALVWGLQASETIQEYNNRLQSIATACGHETAERLRRVPYERWVLAGSIAQNQRPLYGWCSRDFTDASRGVDPTEQPHALIQKLQTTLPIDFLDGVMDHWAKDAYKRSSTYANWVQARLKVTPGAQELYDLEVKHICEFTVTRSSASVAYVSPVHSDSSLSSSLASSASTSNASRCRVDLTTSTCSCVFMQQHAIPCRHVIAAVLFCGQMDSVTSRFDPIYSIASYGAAYNNKVIELPLQEQLTESDKCDPPRRPPKPYSRANKIIAQVDTSDVLGTNDELPVTSTADAQELLANPSTGARKKAKKRARPSDSGGVEDGEPNTTHLPSTAVVRRCSKCKRSGHNARSCTERVQEELVAAIPHSASTSSF